MSITQEKFLVQIFTHASLIQPLVGADVGNMAMMTPVPVMRRVCSIKTAA